MRVPQRRLRLAEGVLLAALLASLSPLATADVVVLKSGWRSEGQVTETPDEVTVELKNGLKVKYPRADVVEIIKKDTPREEFQKKYKEVDRTNFDALKGLATWCRLNGLAQEAVQVADDMLKIDPESDFAKDLIIRFKMTAEHISTDKDREAELAKEFGKDFNLYRSRHYRIVYDTDSEYAQERGKYFERLYEQFYRYFDEMGMPMKFLDDRLEVILFKSRQDYAGYAASRHPALVQTAGFYSQDENRAAFFDSRGEGYYRAFHKEYDAYMRNLRDMRNRLSAWGKSTVVEVTFDDGHKQTFSRDGFRKYIDDSSKKAKDMWDKFQGERMADNLQVTMHEGTHQLAFNLGIHSKDTPVPKWLAEGIATAFEETTPERKAENSGMNERLLKVYRDAAAKPNLRQLLTDDAVWMRFDKQTEVSYAQGWALFYYLSKERKADLVKYLKLLLTNKEDNPYVRLGQFEQCFGPIDEVEKTWRAYIRTARAK